MGKDTNIKNIYSLSPMQEGMLFHALFNSNSNAYFEQSEITAEGFFDINIFEKSINMLIERHEALRTIFIYEKVSKPVQVVLRKLSIKVGFEDLTCSHIEAESHINNFKAQDRQKGFNLSKDVLFRIHIFKIEDSTYKIIWSFHHIIMDGWCLGIIFKEMMTIYHSLKYNTTLNLPPIQPYKVFLDWISKQDKNSGLIYWKNYLEDFEPLSTFIKQKGMVEKEIYIPRKEQFFLSEVLTSKLEKISHKYQVTLNSIFQGIWGILLQKYNDTNDVVFGTVTSGRPYELDGVQEIVGLFINTIPIRIKYDKKTRFIDLIKKAQEEQAQSQMHNYCPLYEIQKNSRNEKELFDHIVVFENYPIEKEVKSLRKSNMDFYVKGFEMYEQTNYDLNIIVLPGTEMRISFLYNEAVIDKKLIERIMTFFTEIANQVSENPEVDVTDISITPICEKELILSSFNNTKAEYRKEKTIYKLFEEQVEKTPNSVAATFKDKKVTYRELNMKANQLARSLREEGVGRNDIVAIMTDRSLEMIIGIMGIVKAGGAYLPISPDYPEERIKYMLEDSGTSILLTQAKYLDKYGYRIKIINLESESHYNWEDTNLEIINSSNDVAYVIYTSGSTGRPKGVLINHYSLVNKLNWRQKKYPIGKGDAILQKTPYTFDVSVWELLWWSFTGAKVSFLEPGEEKNPESIIEAIEKNRITTIHFVPSMLTPFLDYMEDEEKLSRVGSLKQVFCSGEALNIQQVERFKKTIYKRHRTKLHNLYGPTEATIEVSYFDCMIDEELSIVPIGKPIDNTFLYILDKDEKLCPVGVIGELHIAGDGLARGYLNRKELTEEKFVKNPFVEGARMYKTGDLARWMPDGNIEYIGRIDNQVKIRGNRIELGEIEHKLLEHENIKESVVISRKDADGSIYLCGYVVSERELSLVELRQHLLVSLPEYMVPSKFVWLENMPLSSNGKVDRKALPEPPQLINNNEEFSPPRNKVEEILVSIWEEVLCVNNIGIGHNFFHIGGDSIKAIQIISLLHKHGLRFELKYLFEYPTIGGLSRYVKPVARKVSQYSVEGEIDLSPVQQWFFKQKFTNANHWNQSIMLFRQNGFELGYIDKVFRRILEHHDALRIIFKYDNQKVIQHCREMGDNLYTLDVFEFSNDDKYVDKITLECRKIQRKVNHENGPLVRIGLFKTSEGDHLFIVIHHLIIDTVSWRILLEDFSTGYLQVLDNKPIEFMNKTHSYMKWVNLIKDYSLSEKILEEREYWLNIAENELPKIRKDNNIQNSIVKDEETLGFSLSQEYTKKLLNNTNQAYNTKTDDILLTALGLSLRKFTEDDRVLINMESHGRQGINEDIQLERTIGWFTSMYPVVLDFSKKGDVSTLIKNIKEQIRSIPNAGIGFGILKYFSSLNGTEKLSCIKPEISFNYLGQVDRDLRNELFRLSDLLPGFNISPESQRVFSININGIVVDGKINFNFEYNRYEFNPETITKLCDEFRTNLIDIIDHCSSKLNVEYTLSDFNNCEISAEELDSIQNFVSRDIQDIYSISPMQKYIYFQCINSKDSETYFVQQDISINGFVDYSILDKSFNLIIDRYDVFRTVFFSNNPSTPKQIVIKKKYTKIDFIDISNLPEVEINDYVFGLKEKDRKRGFNLSCDNLTRLCLLKIGEEIYKIIWSFHHIIIDGWCLGILAKELFEIYNALKINSMPKLNRPTQYKDYISWINQKDRQMAMEYWTKLTSGYKHNSVIVQRNDLKNENYIYNELSFQLDNNITNKLKSIGSEFNITLSTIFNALWALTLLKYNNVNDLIIGVVVSGRNADLEYIENIIGLTINIIPIRIEVRGTKSFEQLVKEIQGQFVEAYNYSYLPLNELNIYSRNRILDNVIFFENYPFEDSVSKHEQEIGFHLKDIQIFEQTDFPVNVIVNPSDKMDIKISCDENRVDINLLRDIERRLKQIAVEVIKNTKVDVKELII